MIVVEHDEDAIAAADHIIDIGPGAGIHGGEIVAEGTARQIKANKPTLLPDSFSPASAALLFPKLTQQREG